MTLVKTFIRGGQLIYGSNVNLSVGDVLKESQLIPQWGGYPTAKYFIAPDKTIQANQFLKYDEVDQMKIIGCDPLYVRFLNTKGGYSFWLFESYIEKTSTTSKEGIKRRSKSVHLGTSVGMSVEAETRVKEPYYALMKSLIRSPEVYFYQKFGQRWLRVSVDSNDFEENNFDDLTEVSIKFRIDVTENPSLVW